MIKKSNIFDIIKFQRLLKTVISVFILLFSIPLQAQNSKVEFDLFGLTDFPFQEVLSYSYDFNVYRNSWDSYQDIYFNKKNFQLGLGARLTYWINNSFGLRIESSSWNQSQISYANSVVIKYSYYPWYPDLSDVPVEVSYNLESDIPPELLYKINALSLNGLLRKNIGNFTLDLYGGLAAYHMGGELKNIYFKRTEASSHGTFLSEEVIFHNRFDTVSIGGNLGADFSVPIVGNFVGFFGLKLFLGTIKEPTMFVSFMGDLDNYMFSFVMEGIDQIKEHIRNSILKINPSSFALNLGLRYRLPYSVSPIAKKGKFTLILTPGVSKMNPEISYERTFSIYEDGSGRCAQNIDLFNERLALLYGAGSSFHLSSNWAIELCYHHLQKELNVDSGPIILYLDQQWKKHSRYKRPQSNMKIDELKVSLVRYFPIQGAQIFVSAGMNLARLSLTVKDLYFLYWHKPYTTDYVNFSGLYSTIGSSRILGANVGIGFQVPIIGPLQGRLTGSYFIYKETGIQTEIDDIELGDIWGPGNKTQLNQNELQQLVSSNEYSINPSSLKINFALVVRF